MNPKKELYLKTVLQNIKSIKPEIDLSIEELHDIIDSQYTGGLECIFRELPFSFSNFGTFTYSAKDKIKEGRIRVKEEIEKIKEKEKEYKKLNKEFIKQQEFINIAHLKERMINNYKESSKKRNSLKVATLEELSKYKKIDNLNTKYDKILNTLDNETE